MFAKRDAIVLIILNNDFSPLDDVSRDTLKSLRRGVAVAFLIFTRFIVRALAVFVRVSVKNTSEENINNVSSRDSENAVVIR